jgi:hypothetical protein
VRRERSHTDRHPRVQRERFEDRVQLRFVVGSVKPDRPPAAVLGLWAPDAQYVAFPGKRVDPVGFGLRALGDVGRRRPIWDVDGEINEVLRKLLLPSRGVRVDTPASYCGERNCQSVRGGRQYEHGTQRDR